MSSPATVKAAAISPEIRAARGNEMARADYLLGRRAPGALEYLVAVAREPVERLVGVVAWQDAPMAGSAGCHAQFDWTVVTGWRESSLPVDLLAEVSRAVASEGRLTLRSTRLVAPRSWEANALREADFETIASHEHFLLDVARCTPRQRRIHEKMQSRSGLGPLGASPLRTKIERLGPTNVGAAAALVRHFGLMAEERFAEAYRQRTLQEHSIVLIREGIAVGILLARTHGEQDVAIEVLAASDLRAVGSGRICNELFEQLRQNCLAGEIARLYFWAEPRRNPATRRIAARFGGRQVGETVQYGIRLAEGAEWPTASIPASDLPHANLSRPTLNLEDF